MNIEQSETLQKIPKVNTLTLHIFCNSLGMFFLQVGWMIAGNNVTASVIQAQLGYFGKDDEYKTIGSLITSSSVLGMMIGALTAGNLMPHGRRKWLLIFGAIGIAGTGLTLVMQKACIIIGRLIHGLCTGVFMTAGPRMIEETCPSHLISFFGNYTNIYANMGIMIVIFFGAGLPSDNTDETALLADGFWRFAYGFPILSIGIGMIILLLFFRDDSILYCINSNQKESALRLIGKIYNEDEAETYEHIKGGIKPQEQQVSFKDALFAPQYKKATWICFILSLACMNNGLNAVNAYSTTIFEQLNGDVDSNFPFTPIEASYFLGVFNFVGAILAPVGTSMLSRKNNLLYGFSTQGISMILIGIFQIEGQNMALFVFLCLMGIFNQTSTGPLIWIYSNEVIEAAAGGLIVFGFFGMLFIQNICLPYLLLENSLTPQGVFFLFGGLTILGLFFIIFCIKETSGKTDKEKKSLYNTASEIKSTYE